MCKVFLKLLDIASESFQKYCLVKREKSRLTFISFF